MFDNPRKELARLHEELLASEDEYDEEAEYDDVDADDALDEMMSLLRRDDWEEELREPLENAYRTNSQPDYELIIEEPANPAPKPKKIKKPKKQKPKRNRGGVIVAVLLELLCVLALLGWWLLW